MKGEMEVLVDAAWILMTMKNIIISKMYWLCRLSDMSLKAKVHVQGMAGSVHAFPFCGLAALLLTGCAARVGTPDFFSGSMKMGTSC